ncbi:MAG: NUDIX hydrolase [Deltaproteobacteria bacterium]|nr:NUDIX hydrolase [Deltaproteobacteria bacterium]HPW68947.1 NUDIX hydrolase [Deltaproteobacteria bacterium]
MNDTKAPLWLKWAREIQSMSQTGLAYSQSGYDTLRYHRMIEIAAEIVACHTGLSSGPLVQGFSAQPGYATVKVDVRGAVVCTGRILLVKERKDGRWTMPGGWADVGEVPSEMVAREVLEESGFVVKPRKIVGVYDSNRAPKHLEFYHAYKIVFLCEITGGEARPSDETTDVGFFPFDALPPLSAYRTTERHLDDVKTHAENASLPAAFD